MKFSLVNGDCREVLKNYKDKQFDAVITSPPYNMNLRVRGGQYVSRQIVKELSTKYADFDDNLPMEEYAAQQADVIRECIRAADLVFWNVQIITGNKPAIASLLGEFSDKLKEVIVWDKCHGQPAIGEGVLNSQFEFIFIFSDNDARTRSFKNPGFKRGELSNVWAIKRGRKRCKNHGAAFPEELVGRIISSFLPDGAAILDPYTGTGTTGRVALKLGAHFTGIELSPYYYGFALGELISAGGVLE